MRILWKCNAKVSAQIIQSVREWDQMTKDANKLAKSIGARACYFGRPFGSPRLEGFAFKEKPKTGFVKLRGTDDGYTPKSNTELFKKMREFDCEAISLAMKLTGIPQFRNEGGMYVNSVGIVIWKNIAYLETFGTPTKGGKRICDLEFEKVKKLSEKK